MTIEQALQNISQVLAAYRGTLSEHNALQQSLEVVKTELGPKAEESDSKEAS